MVVRRDFIRLSVAGLALSLPVLKGASSAIAQENALRFDPDAHVELSETITTDTGEKSVVYRFYKALPYVARPSDLAYQSLNISVPISIDGEAVDASTAPILCAISVGGYMPSSVADAQGVGGGGMMGVPRRGMSTQAPAAPSAAEVPSGSSAMIERGGRMVSNAKLALAAGYVVVEPGARGRSLVDQSGTYFGVAPAAIVDLKAAIRYLRFNRDLIPGNMDQIITSGTSAGGALSALLAASGDSPLFDEALAEVGAANESDAIFAAGCWCPITDLEHADMAYEWNWGSNPPQSGGLVDQKISSELATAFAAYQESLELMTADNQMLNASNYGQHLVDAYLIPAADRYLLGLNETERETYLAANRFINVEAGHAQFSWNDFLAHVGSRKKNVPAFDTFDLSSAENNLFGVNTTEARHFTRYSLRRTSGNAQAQLAPDLPRKLEQMNPMHFLRAAHAGRARNWWLRVGTKDSDTSLTVVGNLAATAMALGDNVDAAMYWDAGHGANEDAAQFVSWIAEKTGYLA